MHIFYYSLNCGSVRKQMCWHRSLLAKAFGEFWHMGSSSRRSTGGIFNLLLFFFFFASFHSLFNEICSHFSETDVDHRSTHMKFQANNALSYYEKHSLEKKKGGGRERWESSATSWKIRAYAKQYVPGVWSYTPQTEALNSSKKKIFFWI